MALNKRIQLAGTGMTVLALVSCGDKPTTFSSPEAYHSLFLLQGTALDKTKQIAQAVESGEAKGIKIDSGMSREQELKADAEMLAVHARASESTEHKGSDATVASTEVSGSSLPTPSFIESVKAAAASAASARAAAEAAKVTAETEAKAASEAAAKAVSDAAAKSSALVSAQESLKQVMENPSSDDSALNAAKEAAEAAGKAAAEATAKASAGTSAKAEAEAAAKKASEDAAKAASEADAKANIEAAAKAAEQEAEETKAKMSAKTAEQKAQEDEDKKDFEDDGDFEVSMPPQVIGNDPNIFKEACSTAMKVDSKKLVFAKDKAVKVSKEQVLVVYVTSGSMNLKFDGDKIRGLCLYVANGSKVNIPLGKSKINGLFYYQRGAGNSTQTHFSHGGKFRKGIVLFSGENNSASFIGGGEPRCRQLKVLGSSGNLTCKK